MVTYLFFRLVLYCYSIWVKLQSKCLTFCGRESDFTN